MSIHDGESLNATPTGERLQIGIFGKVNAGKSSLLNRLTGQDIAIVSAREGTTTDPVKKAMELLPIGPVMIYDTPGLSDESALGTKREEKTIEVLRRIDVGLLVVDAAELPDGEDEPREASAPADAGEPEAGSRAADTGEPAERASAAPASPQKDYYAPERGLLKSFRERNLPCLVILNKTDVLEAGEEPGSGARTGEADKPVPPESGGSIGSLIRRLAAILEIAPEEIYPFSCRAADAAKQAERLREEIAKKSISHSRDAAGGPGHLVADLIRPKDTIILVIPIDESAPKGRLILPQQQVIRDALEAQAVILAVQPGELKQAVESLKKPPALVVTDSQAFQEVDAILPKEIPLTSFSMLMARYKGDLEWQAKGAAAVGTLADGARILISEGCTHHRQCKDIGTVKLPGWLEGFTGRHFQYEFTSGGQFPADLSGYGLVIHCGGCTLPPGEMRWRIARAKEQGVPITNYGTMIAYLHGILERAMEPFGAIIKGEI